MRLPTRQRFRLTGGTELSFVTAGVRTSPRCCARRQLRALMLWGRHDAFFDLGEVLSWMQALPRMEAHIFDAGHFLLETHAAEAASLLGGFITRHA